jgi:hypothetical protein
MKRKVLSVVAAFGLLAQDAAFARKLGPAAQELAPEPRNGMQLDWDELSNVLLEKKISAVLRDGTKVQGEVLAVRPESLVLDVQKSSRKKVHPVGQAAIARELVGDVRLIRERGSAGRIVGGILGAIGGIYGSVGLGFAADSVGVLVPAMLILIPVSAVSGYYAGKLADRHTTLISIRPVPGAPAAEVE